MEPRTVETRGTHSSRRRPKTRPTQLISQRVSLDTLNSARSGNRIIVIGNVRGGEKYINFYIMFLDEKSDRIGKVSE